MNPRQTKPSSFPSLSFPILALALFFGLGVVATQTQALIKQTHQDLPSAFSSQDFITHTQSVVLFYSKVLLHRTQAQITLPFIPPPDPAIIYVGFTPKDSLQRSEYLIYHPQLDQLTWDYLSQDSLRLYQKTPSYDSISDFISNPPPTRYATDLHLNRQYPQLTHAGATNEFLDLTQYDYILTSYQPSTPQSNYFIYQNTIDVSNAQLNDINEIEWYLRSFQVTTQNPYQVGKINIEFIQ